MADSGVGGPRCPFIGGLVVVLIGRFITSFPSTSAAEATTAASAASSSPTHYDYLLLVERFGWFLTL